MLRPDIMTQMVMLVTRLTNLDLVLAQHASLSLPAIVLAVHMDKCLQLMAPAGWEGQAGMH